MAKIDDTKYLFLTNRVRSLENYLLNQERMDQMLMAHTDLEALKILEECGYPELEELNQETLSQMLADERDRVYEEIYFFTPNPAVVDIFKVKYDYHNIKVLLKSEHQSEIAKHLLVDVGRIPVPQLAEAIHSSEYGDLPVIMREALIEARDIIRTIKDPQLSDFRLDQGYFADMQQLAKEAESPFIEGYVRLCIDAANLRSVIRSQRIGKSVAFLEGVLFPGGNLHKNRIIAATNASAPISDMYATSPLAEAAEAGMKALDGDSLTQFEKLCDNAVSKYLSGARYVPFGDAPVVSYLAAKENELTAVRIILSGRMAGLDGEVIRERLRETYV